MKKTILFPAVFHSSRPVWPTLDMKNLFVLWIIILTAICKTAIAQQGPIRQSFTENPDPKRYGADEGKIKSIDSLLQSFVNDKKVNCVAVFVAKGGNVVYKKAFGLKDIENQIPATIDDYYVLFSQTKAVTTIAFMTLVEKGLVNID